MLSNYHLRMEIINTGKPETVARQTIFKPDIITILQLNMGGVSLVDQMTQAYTSMHKP